VPLADLLKRGEEIARAILAVAPMAVRMTMEAVHVGADVGLAEGLALEAALFGVACGTEDKREGTKAFLEKRAAVWGSHPTHDEAVRRMGHPERSEKSGEGQPNSGEAKK
jgi:1,4-dihydroxy-2-naphthoyl-CoA synthase